MIVKRKNSPYIKNIVNIKSLKYSQNSNCGDVFYKRSVPIKGRRLNFLVKNTYYYSRKNYLIAITVIWKFCGMMSPTILTFSTICVRIRSWQCSLRVPQKQNFQSKNKRVFWNFPTEFVQNTLTIPSGGR